MLTIKNALEAKLSYLTLFGLRRAQSKYPVV
jgi:hypothetical protein